MLVAFLIYPYLSANALTKSSCLDVVPPPLDRFCSLPDSFSSSSSCKSNSWLTIYQVTRSFTMSGWGMPEVAAALPEIANEAVVASEAPTPTEAPAQGRNPQEHGWVAQNSYDYSAYMMTSKELAESRAAAAAEDAGLGLRVETGGDWASNAAVYEWNDEFGDVGPRHPELEKQLFGQDNHVKSGIKFEK